MMSSDEQYYRDDREAVLGILRRHRGRDHAVSSRHIAKSLHLDTRQVREIIAQLVKDGELIGAIVDGRKGGYFMIESSADLEATRAILRSRAVKIFERDRDLCRAWEKVHGRPLQPLLPMMEVV